MSTRQDEIAKKAVRKSTLKSIKVKKQSRLAQLKSEYEEKVREINIQYAEDPERLKAKYAAADYAKTEKAKRRAEKKIAREKERIEYEEKIRKLTLKEEIASAIIQGIGCALFIAGVAILDTITVHKLNDFVNVSTVLFTLFGASMILMYLFSLLKHAIPNYTAKKVFNRLAHIGAFFNIAFCYSVFTITKIQGILGWVLFGVVCALCATGSIIYAISGQKHEKVNAFFYIISGFCGIVLAKTLFDILSTQSFAMLCFAVGFYIAGIIFYNLKKVKYMHLVANILMLCGSVYIFFALFFIGA